MKKIVSLVLTAVLALSAAFVSIPSSNVEAATKAKSQKTVKLVTESINPNTEAITKYTYYKNGLLKKATTTYPTNEYVVGYRSPGSMAGGDGRSNIKATTVKDFYYHTHGKAKGLLKKVVTTRNITNKQSIYSSNASEPYSAGLKWTDTFTVTSTDQYKYNKSTIKQIQSVTQIPSQPTISNVEKNAYINWSNIAPETVQPLADAKADELLSQLHAATYENHYNYLTTTRTFTNQTSNQVIIKSKTSSKKHNYVHYSTSNYYFNKKGYLTKRYYDAYNAKEMPTFSSSYNYRYDKKSQLKKIRVTTFSGFDHLAEGYPVEDYPNERELWFTFVYPYGSYKTLRYNFDNESYINFGGEYYLNYVCDSEYDASEDDDYKYSDFDNTHYDCDYDSNIDQKVLLPANLIRLSSPKFKKAKVSSFYSQKVKDQQYKLLNQVNTINTFGL